MSKVNLHTLKSEIINTVAIKAEKKCAHKPLSANSGLNTSFEENGYYLINGKCVPVIFPR